MVTSRGGMGVFLAAVCRRPTAVGTVLPSSRALASRLAAVVSGRGDPVVVELGAGTGSVTSSIVDRLPARSRYIAVELDSGMAEHLRARLPGVDVACADAADLDKVLVERGLDQVDVVLSGLPWGLMSQAQQRQVLGHVVRYLPVSGVFVTVGYLAGMPLRRMRAFRQRACELFDEVTVSAVWRNVPPGVIHVCRGPRPHTARMPDGGVSDGD